MRKSACVVAAAAALAGMPGGVLAQTYSATSTYANPDSTTTDVHRRRGPCSDPWVTIALIRVYGAADPAKCSVSLYNNGRWRDFNELVHAVAKKRPLPVFYFTSVTWKQLTPNRVELLDPSNRKLGELVDGRFVVDPGLAAMVAAGGGNLIGNDGSTMVAAGGGNLVGNDGASIIERKLDVARLTQGGAGYSLQAAKTYRMLKDATRRR